MAFLFPSAFPEEGGTTRTTNGVLGSVRFSKRETKEERKHSHLLSFECASSARFRERKVRGVWHGVWEPDRTGESLAPEARLREEAAAFECMSTIKVSLKLLLLQ